MQNKAVVGGPHGRHAVCDQHKRDGPPGGGIKNQCVQARPGAPPDVRLPDGETAPSAATTLSRVDACWAIAAATSTCAAAPNVMRETRCVQLLLPPPRAAAREALDARRNARLESPEPAAHRLGRVHEQHEVDGQGRGLAPAMPRGKPFALFLFPFKVCFYESFLSCGLL